MRQQAGINKVTRELIKFSAGLILVLLYLRNEGSSYNLRPFYYAEYNQVTLAPSLATPSSGDRNTTQ